MECDSGTGHFFEHGIHHRLTPLQDAVNLRRAKVNVDRWVVKQDMVREACQDL